jgi:hypothetical protein
LHRQRGRKKTLSVDDGSLGRKGKKKKRKKEVVSVNDSSLGRKKKKEKEKKRSSPSSSRNLDFRTWLSGPGF